jgi:hypothetical protein
MDGVPLVESDINYYLTTRRMVGENALGEVIAHGTAKTGQGGAFQIDADMPEELCVVNTLFEVVQGQHPVNPYHSHNSTDGKRYISMRDYFSAGSMTESYGTGDLEFETTPLQVGGSTLITVSGDYILEHGQISVYVGNQDDFITNIDHQEWDRIWHYHSFYRTEDGIQAGITIPEFLPMNDQEYSIFVSFSDDDMGTNTHYNFVTIRNGESGKSTIVEEENGDDPDNIPVIGFAGIVIASVMMVISLRIAGIRKVK